MEQLIALAERSGLKGPELLQFVEKHTADEEARQKRILEREERAADRELRKLELERQAKGEAEQNALKKFELERQAKGEAEQNALKKFELERQAKVEALDSERQAKAEAEANAMKKVDLERQAKAEADECAMRKPELERKMKTESNKLKMQWRGPFPVLKRFGEADYVIQFPHRAKTFHANMLKRYYERQPEIENRSNEEAVNDEMQAVGAAVVVEELSDAEMRLTGEGNLPLFNNLQRETYKDVEI